MKVTFNKDPRRRGKFEVRRAHDDSFVSQHNEEKEAIEAAENGYPERRYVVAPIIDCFVTVYVDGVALPPSGELPGPVPPAEPAPDPGPAPDPQPPVDPPPSGDLVMGEDNSPIAAMARPTRAQPQADPAYHLLIEQATDAGDSDNGASWIRNDYSRRQAFNADENFYIAVASNGFWWLYDTATRRPIMRLPHLAGSCEPIWHPTNPAKLYYHPINGGMSINELAINAGARTASTRQVASFDGKLPWPDVRRCWMKDEGSPSADGRYWCFQAETEGFQIRGAFVYDLQEGKVLGTKSLSQRPDHASISPCGKYAVLSGDGSDGTAQYDRDTFALVRQLHHKSEHSDMGLLPDGHSYYIAIDYQSSGGDVFWIDMETGGKKPLFQTYVAGSTTAIHFSGKAYRRPGTVCISTYARNGQKQWHHQKVFLADIVDGTTDTIANLCHHRSEGGGYYGEPHATISPTGRYVLFNSNWGTGDASQHCAMMIELPARPPS